MLSSGRYTGGLAKSDGANWTGYNTADSGLPCNSVKCIAIDAQGNKWIATARGLVRFDGPDWTVYASKPLCQSRSEARGLAQDARVRPPSMRTRPTQQGTRPLHWPALDTGALDLLYITQLWGSLGSSTPPDFQTKP